ncbi:Alpha/Beta hydrolase protein [Jimgerdemannia flammicorona]|uniref:Alpha/Beta hydrolase protein n=1 Tax=Jimgerdemannia flammicorona TaxID=994334 RepID=A0A433Q688_9FUNG|nr:Alpha/Beta hydrolase protein [Jimgerdemannia flammicorona]
MTNVQAESHFIPSTDGTKLHVLTTGPRNNGYPSIFFLHGFGQSLYSWSPQLEDPVLTRRFHLVAIDLRGHGQSDKPTQQEAYQNGQQWAEDIRAVMDALELDRVVLVGWSYGGIFICDYLRAFGEDRLAAVVFVDASFDVGIAETMHLLGPEFLALGPGMSSDDTAIASRAISKFVDIMGFKPLEPRVRYEIIGCIFTLTPDTRRAMSTAKRSGQPQLAEVTVPTMVMQGREDMVVTKESAKWLVERVRHAKYIEYRECGHVPFLEKAAMFNKDLEKFVTSVDL